MKLTIPFGKFQPDQASFKNPGVISARNVVPQVGSYGPFRDPSVFSGALSGRVLGATFARSNAGVTYMYAGDATKLYELANATWTDQSKALGYTTGTSDVWEFAWWNRNNKIIATNYTDPVQVMTVGGGGAGEFADMFTSTNKPKAKHIGIVNQFVMLGYTNDATDGERQSRVWWSALGDETDADPDAATQSDYEDLSSGGQVQRILGLTEYGLVLQKDMVRVARYVGGGVIFEFLPLNYAPGTPLPNSVISHKNMVFYISDDGFMAINGASVEPIGHGQVDRYFWNQFDIGYRRGISAAIDPVRKVVCWAFSGEGSSSELPTKLLMFNYADGKWADADVDLDMIVRTETTGYTLDGLDTIGTDIDVAAVFNESFDSDKWKGGSIRLGAFNRDHKLAYFTGAIKSGSIITGDIQPVEGRRSQINSIRPLIDGGEAQVSVASRTRLKDTVTFGAPSTMNTDGLCNPCVEGRYHRVNTSITASVSWSHIQGLQIDYELTGEF